MIFNSPKWKSSSPYCLAAAAVLAVLCVQGCSSETPPLVHRTVEAPAPTVAKSAPLTDNQRLYTPKPPPPEVVTPCPSFPITEEQKAKTIERFMQVVVGTNGAPRTVLFMNRELVDEETGLNLQGRAVNAITGASGTTITETNSYRNLTRTNLNLADKQVIRDMEAAFMYPFRLAGVPFVDQRVAAQMLSNLKIQDMTSRTESEAARKDREALSQNVDVVIECLVEFKPVANSGNPPMSITDIHVTAIRLKDAQILGHASTSDVVKPYDDVTVGRCFSWHDITEGAAIKLMEDMVLTGKPAR